MSKKYYYKPTYFTPKTPTESYVKDKIAHVFHDVESMWVGFGLVGNKHKRGRRFLRVRNTIGISRYYYWTDPKKGMQLPVVFQFRKRVQVTKEQVTKHYNRL